MPEDVRWRQRYINFNRAVQLLNEGVEEYNELTPDIVLEGIVQRFEYTYELSWKLIKDYLKYRYDVQVPGSRRAVEEGARVSLIENQELWSKMIDVRVATSHTYKQDILDEVLPQIINDFLPLFEALREKMNAFYEEDA